MTSKDVKYAIERGFFKRSTTATRPYFGDIDGAKAGVKPGTEIKGIETPDDHTVVFKLSKRDRRRSLAAGALALPLLGAVPKEYAAKFDQENPSTYGEYQVATGPYMIENDAAGKAIGYQPGKRIHLVRNPNWDKSTDYKPAYLDEIDNLEGNDDPDVASRQILDRQGHGQRRLLAAAGDPQAGRRQQEGPARSRPVAAACRYIPLNMTVKPFDDINVRKAVIAGFDRNALRLPPAAR